MNDVWSSRVNTDLPQEAQYLRKICTDKLLGTNSGKKTLKLGIQCQLNEVFIIKHSKKEFLNLFNWNHVTTDL